jgi:hypothetical protein
MSRTSLDVEPHIPTKPTLGYSMKIIRNRNLGVKNREAKLFIMAIKQSKTTNFVEQSNILR